GFTAWSLLPANRATLKLFEKHNIDYSNTLARRSAAPVGAALKLNTLLSKKKELEGMLTQSRGGIEQESVLGTPSSEENHSEVSVQTLPEEEIPSVLVPPESREVLSDSTEDEIEEGDFEELP